MIPAQKPRHSLAESDALPLRRAVLQHSAVAQNYQGMASERSRCHGSIWLDPGPRMEAERLCRVGLGAGSKTLAATHFAASLIADLTNRLGFRRLEERTHGHPQRHTSTHKTVHSLLPKQVGIPARSSKATMHQTSKVCRLV
jgi:hypothetical protein